MRPLLSMIGPWGTLALAGLPALAAAKPVGSEFQVNTETALSQAAFRRAVAADANGNFVVVWSSSNQDGSGLGVFGQRYDNQGKPRGGEFQINAYTPYHQDAASVASDADGIVSGPPAAAARVRVSWTDDRAVSDASDVTFQIRPVGASTS